jgi:cytochrome P450
MFVQEVLRVQPTNQSTSFYDVKQDFTVGKHTFYKDSKVFFYLPALHNNSKQWQRPTEFLPERFDQSNPLSQTPDG